MNESGRPDLDTFAAEVLSRLGFRLDEHNVDPVEQALRERLERTGARAVETYVRRFLEEPGFRREELRELALRLTVPETYFLRHREQFQALEQVAAPACLEGREATRPLSVLSAGCASGEEAYSLAATLLKVPRIEQVQARILGVDVNGKLLEKARKGHYSEWALRGLGQAERGRLFRRQGEDYLLEPRLKAMVQFEEGNLLEDSWWQERRFDIVFCRNVLIYFSPRAIAKVVGFLGQAIVPGGFLFLGPSETLRGMSHEFHLRHTHEAFYYQRRLPGEKVTPFVLTGAEQRESRAFSAPSARPFAPTEEREKAREASPAVPAEPHGIEQTDWASSIAAATERIAALARGRKPRPHEPARGGRESAPVSAEGDQSRPTSAAPGGKAGAFPAREDLEEVRGLVREERFEEALAALEGAPETGGADPDRLLIQAVVLANSGQMERAKGLCEQLLTHDELRPGAHYLMAVCEEKSGQALAAAEHDRMAIYLDGKFAMPRLHLGLLARRLGDVRTARRELGEALTLLGREDAGRLLLFGGGFSRAALLQFCRAQLELCGPGA